jgi:hypothetical protein
MAIHSIAADEPEDSSCRDEQRQNQQGGGAKWASSSFASACDRNDYRDERDERLTGL